MRRPKGGGRRVTMQGLGQDVMLDNDVSLLCGQ